MLLALGWNAGLCVALGLGAGWWCDSWLNSTPWGMMGGILLGIAAAAVQFYRVIRMSVNRHESTSTRH
jgi:F0F1-type ATP synthase assembly protein I